jgi:hypothetical protein
LAKKFNRHLDLVQMWYPSLWKQKATYHFYEVNNAFISSFKKLIQGPSTSILSLEETSFLDKRGILKEMDNLCVFMLYFSPKKSSYHAYYVSYNILVVEICKQYKFWDHFFNVKIKRQSILLPWKIGEIMVKIITDINEIFIQFDQFNLKTDTEFKVFNPSQLFMKHMASVGYNVSFSNTFMFG